MIAASCCAAVPHILFSREDINVAMAMIGIAALSWCATLLVFSCSRRWFAILALGLATVSVLLTWGIHICIAYKTFRMYIGIPSALEFTMAALWWGTYFSVLFVVAYPLHRHERFKSYPNTNDGPQHPGGTLARIFFAINLVIVAVLALITVTTGSYQLSLPTMGSLHLPIQTIKDSSRAGFGSGGYLQGSMILYALFGTLFQCGLAWLVCCIGFYFGIIKPATNNDA